MLLRLKSSINLKLESAVAVLAGCSVPSEVLKVISLLSENSNTLR